MVMIMLSHVLGEFQMHERLSGIDFVDQFDEKVKPDVMALTELPALFDSYFGKTGEGPWPTG